MGNTYRWNGVVIGTALPLRRVAPAPGVRPDVQVELDLDRAAPRNGNSGRRIARHRPGGEIWAEAVGRIIVTPSHIWIQPHGRDVPCERIERYILHAALCLWALDRGVVGWHGVAVYTERRGLELVLGPSGAGKSTLAARRIVHEGGQLVADDVVLLRPRDTRLTMQAGATLLRLRGPPQDDLRDLGRFEVLEGSTKAEYVVPRVASERVFSVATVTVLNGRGPGEELMHPGLGDILAACMLWPHMDTHERVWATDAALGLLFSSAARCRRGHPYWG